DVPAGDIGVGAREIGYLFGQYRRLKNEFTGTMTGKGLAYGGSVIRPQATGYGNVYFAREMLNNRRDGLEGKSCLVSGSGNVAQYTAEKLIELGAKVLTLSDSGGFVLAPDGINSEMLEFVMDHRRYARHHRLLRRTACQLKNTPRGRLQEFATEFGLAFHAGQRPWAVKADLAFPSATQNEIDLSDAHDLLKNGCFLVSEGANMPATYEATQLFGEARILFGPGKAANAGGVAISGLEMTQNSIRMQWTREEVDQKLQKIMATIHGTCVHHGQKTDNYVDYVLGANVGGFVKVANAMLAYGAV
ncbi:MAG: glutamate dehydrogenase (NADP+), partial [Rhodothermales bacterium]